MQLTKFAYPILTLILLSIGTSFAQDTTRTTKPAGGVTKEMQELYDQHHGINNKPGASNTSVINRSDQMPTETRTPRVLIGVRGGVTYPILTEKILGVDPNIGFVGGLTFNLGTGNVSFQPEVNYARYALKSSLVVGKSAFDQIEVPLLLKLSTGSYDDTRFFVNVGPYVSYLSSRSVGGKKEPVDKAADRFHFGGALGVGTSLKAGPGHVVVEVRGLYQFGTTQTGFSADSKVILMQGTVGYSIPLGGRR